MALSRLAKEFPTGEDLDRAIQRTVAFVGQLPKEDRYRPLAGGDQASFLSLSHEDFTAEDAGIFPRRLALAILV